MPNKLTKLEVLNRANKIHNSKYDYPNFVYINRRMKIDIVCPYHGLFQQNLSDHLYNKSGCSKCKSQKTSKEKTKPFKYFKDKANLVHDFFYDYSKSEECYVDSRHKVPIICPEHGEFFQAFYNHVNARAGCPKCNHSKGELFIGKCLKKQKISFKTQKTFDDCKGIKNKLPFDFYLPEFNTCIEFDGRQHFEPVCFNGINFKDAHQNFEKLKINDDTKNKFCKENNITLIRISYKDNIVSLLETILHRCREYHQGQGL